MIKHKLIISQVHVKFMNFHICGQTYIVKINFIVHYMLIINTLEVALLWLLEMAKEN